MTQTAPARRGAERLQRLATWSVRHPVGADLVVAVVLAALLGGLSVGAASGTAWGTGRAAVIIVAFVVVHVCVLARRSATVPAFAVASAAMLVAALTPAGHITNPTAGGLTQLPAVVLPSSVVFLLLLYTVALRSPEAIARGSLGIALPGGVLVAARMTQALNDADSGGWLVTTYLGIAVAVIVTGVWAPAAEAVGAGGCCSACCHGRACPDRPRDA